MTAKFNSEIFLSTFNELEKHFKSEYFRGQWKSFKQMIKEGSRKSPVIYQFKEDLFEFTDLRNAIVHNRNHNYQVIAEPHDFIVERFANISESIMNPEKVSMFFKNVHTCSINDAISIPVLLFYKYRISQIPVLDDNNKIHEVLNANTIANWVAANGFNNDKDCKVHEVLRQKEYKHNYSIIPESMSVYDAAELYKQSYKDIPHNKYFDSLLITESGINSQPIKGIIVLSDIARYI